METAENRIKTNKYGQVILSSDSLKELLLQGKNISHLIVVRDEEIALFEKYQSELLSKTVIFLNAPEEILSFDDFHERCSEEWIFPIIYQQLDVKAWLLDKCTGQEQIDRVLQEYQMFEDRDLIMLLRMFIYLISYLRENKFIWGVGRGSSVSSYILYLIGVHRVDSLKYQLEIKDYLK